MLFLCSASQDKDSFGFSPKGKKVYAKMYGGDDAEDQEESEDDEEDTVRSLPFLLSSPFARLAH